MTESLLKFAFATFLLAVSPGPDNIYVLSQSMARGAKYGMATSAGLITGCIVHTAIVALGVGVIISDNLMLLNLISLAGAFYLLFLSYKVFSSMSSPTSVASDTEASSVSKLYRIGITMNVLNPKVTLFFLSILPGFMIKDGPEIWLQTVMLGAVFILVSLIVFSGISVAAGRLADHLGLRSGIPKWLDWFQIAVLVGIAIFIIIEIVNRS